MRRILASLLLLASSAIIAHGEPSTSANWQSELNQWRADREKSLHSPTGWFSLVGLDWLTEGANPTGTAQDNKIQLTVKDPQGSLAHLGTFTLRGKAISIEAPPTGFPATLQINGKTVSPGTIQLDADDSGHPSVLTAGSATITIIHRDVRYALRVKDAQADTLLNFSNLHWYDPDPRYVITARWIPFPTPQEIKIPTVLGTTDTGKAPGLAEFTLDGQTVQLEPILEGNHLFFILRDQTSHTTTYGAARFLYTELPTSGLDKPGSLVLDLNKLTNPPCAYTPYATCPLPPEKNRLAISIPAGEKRYSH